jgi:Tol biopolymer transport system component
MVATSAAALGVGPAGANFDANIRLLKRQLVSVEKNVGSVHIAFIDKSKADRDDIFIIKNDGTEVIRVLEGAKDEHFDNLIWSPSAQLFAVRSQAGLEHYIQILDKGLKSIGKIASEFKITPLAWLADGSKLIYSSLEEDSIGKIYLYDQKTKQSEVIRNNRTDRVSWSPDRSKFVFDYGFTENNTWWNNIYIYTIKEKSFELLTNDDAYSPDWSPQGGQIAYITYDDDYNELIKIINVDNRQESILVTSGGMLFHPSWSSDGGKVAYMEGLDYKELKLKVINVDGTGDTVLAEEINVRSNYPFPWYGQQLLFTSLEGELYLANVTDHSWLNPKSESELRTTGL